VIASRVSPRTSRKCVRSDRTGSILFDFHYVVSATISTIMGSASRLRLTEF